MLSRVLEPEVMDTAQDATEYDQMDHRQVNDTFVDDFLAVLDRGALPVQQPRRIFDAGTGTALIPIALMKRDLNATITACDLAESMLVVAKHNVMAAGFDHSIELVLRDCKKLPEDDASYDAIISNSIIHHIPEPKQVLSELWRILRSGGILFIRDLMRPSESSDLDYLVTTYAGTANQYQQKMFWESLHAALTLTEIRNLVRELDLPEGSVRATSDRHWTMCARK